MIRKTRLSREEYERRVLRKLREELLEEDFVVEREGHVKVEDVRLDTSGPLHQVHILFREGSRPECLFGYWMEAVEAEEESSAGSILVYGGEGPEGWASTFIVTLFEEQVEAVDPGLPPDCDSESITWVNGYRRLPPE